MLFKDYHIPMIRSGSKTVTRREWSDNYGRPTVGSVQIASDEMFTSDDEADCYIRILGVYDQPLGEMDDGGARAEGDYGSLEEFREGYERVYGEGAWNPEKVVTVVEFRYVGRERPEEQRQLITDGGRAEEAEHTPQNPHCPECGRWAHIGAVPAPGPSAGMKEVPCCLYCGVNPPRCSFEDGSVSGCTQKATHSGAEKPNLRDRPWCSEHAPKPAEPYPYAEGEE